MDDRDQSGAPEPAVDGSDRLNSWKEIGAYLGRTATTLQRWEASEGLPVHRLAHAKKGSVYAFRSELDAWRRQRTSRSTDPVETVAPEAPPRSTQVAAAPLSIFRSPVAIRTAVSVAVVILAATVVGLTWALSRLNGPVPETPKHLFARSPEPGTVTLWWTAASLTEDRFEIGRFGKIFGTVGPGINSAEFKGLDAGTSYHWDVRACNASGCSPWHGVAGQTPDGSGASSGVPDLPVVAETTAILFVSNRATGRSQIFLMQADGSRVTRVTNSSANDSFPAWSPDRARIAFISGRTGASDVYVMRANGSAIVNLTHDPADDYSPAWSPDGGTIAFVSMRSGDMDVWVMKPDGSNPVNLTRSPGYDGQPSWSPDGKRIAFSSGRNGDLDIYVMEADGSNRRRLTTDGAVESFPAWGPDGRIAFQSAKDGNDELYLIDADGSHETRVTNHPRADMSPTWSPDGSRIVFASNRDGHKQIYSIEPDGSGLARLTNSPVTDSAPAWGLLRLAVRASR